MEALQKHLQQLDSKTRQEILREIQSHIDESQCPDEALVERFGEPEKLAASYMEDLPETQRKSTSRAKSMGKSLLMTLGGIVVATVVLSTLAYWYFSGDDFNYENQEAAELREGFGGWKSKKVTGKINLLAHQSQIIVYWHDKEEISWSCKSADDPAISESNIEISRDHCYLYLPQRESAISASQSQVVAITPKADININVHQSTLRIAEPDEGLSYNINNSDSWINDLKHNENASVSITVTADQSTVKPYQQED